MTTITCLLIVQESYSLTCLSAFRAQRQARLRWLSFGRIVSRVVRILFYRRFFVLIPFWVLQTLSTSHLLALFSPTAPIKSWRRVTVFSVGLQMPYCTRGRTVPVFTVSHTQTHTKKTPEKSVLRRLQSLRKTDARVICLSSVLTSMCTRAPITMFLFVFQGERPGNSRAGVLCCQVGYDQLFHFISDLSGDLKFLRFVVIIKWPGNTTTHIVAFVKVCFADAGHVIKTIKC